MEWLTVGVELLFLFALFYPVVRSLEGTQGEGIIKGYIFLFGLFSPGLIIVSDYLTLYHVKYILTQLVPLYLVASIVIFQQETRVGLLRIGELFGRSKAAFAYEKEVLAALAFLARKKVGALIAVEQEVGMNHYLAQGIMLDSKLTKELLWTIFWPGSPLHDGGVIIQRGRITAARCIFPLSEKQMSSSPVGTRHRAALGISEVTDSLIFVVSEERGEISFCFKGQIYQNISLQELEERLKKFMASGLRHA